MKVCEAHDSKCVVIFNGEGCPFCKAEATLKTIREQLEKSIGILKELKQMAEEGGWKIK